MTWVTIVLCVVFWISGFASGHGSGVRFMKNLQNKYR